ncbi:hypothetical protein BD410DRAFT_796100 [Rickenella mellea]|uniref:Uncharacterized protein n=1 Tax=Rickenella mellea TaxID=50990 RepID=A0A4Y7PKT4_9AGAM|nr:hypothetical protein BD410DRAFT_796100 [Rickenella mellea]
MTLRCLPTISPGPTDQHVTMQSTKRHPIFSLLPELLAEIFVYSVPDTNPCENEAPINVSSVCKAWRKIAISTPHLWSEVYIVQFSYFARLPSAQTIKTWISRSGGCGFSFFINWEMVMSWDEGQFKAIIDVLLDNCELWRNIHITIRQNYSDELLSAIPMRTPNLQKLNIHALQFSMANLFNAPLLHLTHLRILSTTIYSPPCTSLALENLRSLSLTSTKHGDVVECLSRSLRLEEVSATFKFTTEESRQIRDRVCFKLEYLRHLDLNVDVHGWEKGEPGPIDHIDVPALETLLLLVYNCEVPNETDLWDLSINIVSRYEVSLKNLEMTVQCCEQPQPVFIGRIQNLKHLGIDIKYLNDTFIHALVGRFPSPTQQPCQTKSCLESLRISDNHEYRNEAAVNTIIDLARKEKSSNAVIIVLPSHFLIPSDSVVEIMGDEDWEKQRPDLYRSIGW